MNAQLLANPVLWIAAYALYRIFFTAPGRRPLDEDMTNA